MALALARGLAMARDRLALVYYSDTHQNKAIHIHT